MSNFVKLLYVRFRNLILYGVIGCFTAGLDFLVFTLLTKYVGLYYLFANCISVMVGITISFILNRSINFKVKDDAVKRFAIFLTVGLCGLLLSNIILYLGIDVRGGDRVVVKLLSVVLVVLFQFLLNKFVTFRETHE